MLIDTEAIIAALESAHAIAYLANHPKDFKKGENVVINLSGRGDKDMESVKKFLENRSE